MKTILNTSFDYSLESSLENPMKCEDYTVRATVIQYTMKPLEETAQNYIWQYTQALTGSRRWGRADKDLLLYDIIWLYSK